MYEFWFHMKHTPLTRNVSPERLYESPAIGAAFDRLCYVADRQQYAEVTADSGCGKSTLIRRFAASPPSDKYILLYLSDSKLTPKWLYKGYSALICMMRWVLWQLSHREHTSSVE